MKYKVKDSITKKKLVEHFPEHSQKQRVWDKEECKWQEISLKDRLRGRKFTFTKIEDKDTATVFYCEGESQRVSWVEYTIKKDTRVLRPKVLPLVIKKPEKKKQPEE